MKSLEQEFAEYKDHHMYEMIISALLMCGNEGIFEDRLLEEYKDCDLTGKEKVYFIADDLYDNKEDNEEHYKAVYEMCWNRIVNRINDNVSFRIGVNYED